MIRYNGVDLETTIPGLQIQDVVVSAPRLETVLTPKTMDSGSYFIRNRTVGRTITLTVDIMLNEMVERMLAAQAAMAWAQSSIPMPLELESRPGLFLNAVCTTMPDFSHRDWWAPLIFVFEAVDPCFVSETEKTAAVGSSFAVGGDAPAIGRIIFNPSTETPSPQWTLDGGPSIKLTKTIAAGQSVEVNLDSRRVDVNGSPTPITLTSRYFDLIPGSHAITGSGGTVAWAERML